MKTTCEPDVRQEICSCPLCGQTLSSPRALLSLDLFGAPCPGVPWCRVTEQDGTVHLVLVPGRTPDSADITAFVTTYVRSAVTKTVLCNLAAFETLNSLLVARLVTLQRILQAAAQRLVLCGVGPLVQEEFAILKLDRFFEIMSDLPPAAPSRTFAAC